MRLTRGQWVALALLVNELRGLLLVAKALPLLWPWFCGLL